MIPYAELCQALERYRSRMGLAPSGSAIATPNRAATAPDQGQPAWGAGEDATSVSGRGAPSDEPLDDLADPPSGTVDVGEMDILDEEPN